MKRNITNNKIGNVGKCYTKLQIEKFNNNAQPLYCILDENFNSCIEPIGYTLDNEEFVDFINKGFNNYKIGNQLQQ